MKKTFDIKTILIPIDFSETSILALDHAVFMAYRFNAKIVIVHILETFSYQAEISQMLVQSVKIGDVVKEKLDELAKDVHRKSGIDVSTEFGSGAVATTVVEIAKKVKADIIVMGTHGSSGVEEFLIGSNAYKVVTSADVPVLSIQAYAEKVGFKDIIIPLDNSKPSRQKIRYAVPFAKKYNSRLHVVSLITDTDYEHKFDVIENQVTDYLDSQDVPYDKKRVYGDNLAKMTMDYAEEIKANLIMMMTEQEPNFSGFIMGPYAQQIVNHSKIPVVSITPDEVSKVNLRITPY